MFTLPNPIVVTSVSRYQRHEVHLTDGPQALVTFVARDEAGKRVDGAPVAVVTLTNDAYNEFNENWRTEKDVYTLCLDLVTRKVPGASISGVDLSKATGMTVGDVPEVVAENSPSE